MSMSSKTAHLVILACAFYFTLNAVKPDETTKTRDYTMYQVKICKLYSKAKPGGSQRYRNNASACKLMQKEIYIA